MLRHYKEKFSPDAEFVWVRSVKIGDSRSTPGRRVDRKQLAEFRGLEADHPLLVFMLEDFWDAEIIALAPDVEPPEDNILLGSASHPSVVTISDGVDMSLGDLVREAHIESGMPVNDWNGLEDEEREILIELTLERLRGEA